HAEKADGRAVGAVDDALASGRLIVVDVGVAYLEVANAKVQLRAARELVGGAGGEPSTVLVGQAHAARGRVGHRGLVDGNARLQRQSVAHLVGRSQRITPDVAEIERQRVERGAALGTARPNQGQLLHRAPAG